MFSGFYCKKCNIIPLIRHNILDSKIINFTVKCKCNTKFLTYDKLYNNYYSKNIEQKTIINEKINAEIIENKEPILQKIEEILDIIRYNNHQLIRIKNKFIDYMNSFINEISNLINKLMNINEKIEKTSLIFIDSYKTISTNFSNIKNINFILDNKIEKINENLFETFLICNFKEAYSNIKDKFDLYFQTNQQLENFSEVPVMKIFDIIALSNELLLMQNKKYLYFFSIKDYEIIGKIKSDSCINIGKTQKSNILCLFPDCIKIYPEITYNQIISLKNNKSEKEKEDYFEYDIDYEYDDFHISLLDIEPLMIFILDLKYNAILYWKEDNYESNKNKFLLYDKNVIDFFEYNLFEKSVIKYHTYHLDLFKIKLIKYKNNNTLILFSPSNLFLFDLFSLSIIGNFKMKFEKDKETTVVKINDDELLITIDRYMYILNLKSFKIKLKIKYENKITYSFIFNDKSIIICGITHAKKYSPKTFEVMCNFYICREKSEDYCSDYDYDEPYINKTRYFFSISKCIELPNSIYLLLLSNGECELHKLII